MNRKIYVMPIFIALCGILGLNSCRPAEAPVPTDERPVIPNKESVVVPVAINVDKSYENDESVIAEGDESYIDIPSGLEITRSLKDYQKDEQLENGVHYRVLAYRKDENKHVLEVNEDFVFGSDKKLDLDKTKKYTLIIYSFGDTNEVPKPDNISDINKVSINYTKAKLFLYDRKDDYIPSDEILKLKLRNQFTGIKIVLDEGIAGPMSSISEAKLTYKAIEKAVFNLDNGKPTIESSNRNVVIDELNFKGPRESRESDWNYMILSPENQEFSFEAKVSMDTSMAGVDLGEMKIKLNVKGNARQTIKIGHQLKGTPYTLKDIKK